MTAQNTASTTDWFRAVEQGTYSTAGRQEQDAARFALGHLHTRYERMERALTYIAQDPDTNLALIAEEALDQEEAHA